MNGGNVSNVSIEDNGGHKSLGKLNAIMLTRAILHVNKRFLVVPTPFFNVGLGLTISEPSNKKHTRTNIEKGGKGGDK